MDRIVRIKNKKYILSVSFANYLKDKTGMPKVMMAHQVMYNSVGISYISLFSVKKNILHDKVMLFCKFGLIIDGEFQGIFQMSQLIHMFVEWQKYGYRMLDIHIHHLLYVNLSLVSELLSACKEIPIKVYLHDYYFACTRYNLLRNGSEYCGGKGLNEQTCKGCTEYNRSCDTEKKIHKLFGAFLNRIIFVSPSVTTKNIFLRFHPEYAKQVIVIPHQKCNGHFKGNLEKVTSSDKIRVAFLGMPKAHKGWNAWNKIISKYSDKEEYEFYVFNSADEQYDRMKKVNVAFNKDNLNAMTDALRENKIHVVLLWALWPETYSYTCFEAFASNTYIITNRNSGNIADVIETNGNGKILSDEKELIDLFGDTLLLKNKINEFRNLTEGGPDCLEENDEIVKISLQYIGESEIVDTYKFVNYPLLRILNAVYR